MYACTLDKSLFSRYQKKKHGHVYLVGLYLYIFLYPVQRGNLPGNTSHYPNILYTPSVLQTYQQLGKYVKKNITKNVFKKMNLPPSHRDVKGKGSFRAKFSPFAKFEITTLITILVPYKEKSSTS